MSNEIVVKGADGQPVTTSLAIATGTRVQHKNVLELVRGHAASLAQFGGVAFETRTIDTAGGAQQCEVAILNEPQSSLLIAFMRNSAVVVAFKVALVKEFYDMRAALAAQASAPAELSRLELLQLAMQSEVERLALAGKIAADAPKVAFAEAIRAIDGVCHIEKIAKTIGIGRNKFFKALKEASILMPNNLPYQRYLDKGYFTVIEQGPYTDSKGVQHPTFTAMVTGAGQVFLTRKYSAKAAA